MSCRWIVPALLVFVASVIAGCALPPPLKGEDIKPGESVIIFKAYERRADGDGKDDPNPDIDDFWLNVRFERFAPGDVDDQYYDRPERKEFAILWVPPGKYFFESYIPHFANAYPVRIEQEFGRYEFEVKPDAAVYIGDIVLKSVRAGKFILAWYDFDIAIEDDVANARALFDYRFARSSLTFVNRPMTLVKAIDRKAVADQQKADEYQFCMAKWRGNTDYCSHLAPK